MADSDDSPQARLKALRDAVAECPPAQRKRFRKRIDGMARALAAGKPIDRPLKAVASEIEASGEALRLRRENLPTPEYPEELPVCERREEIKKAIAENQVVVVAGETGSGKTTQLPKICLELGRGVNGLIGHTQPRRIAARSVAARIATELKSELGHAVGYKVRFSDRTRPESYIKLMTDGILLAESQGDRFLSAYDTLIIDEAHERSLNIDFLLGYLKQLLPKRPDLKLIITSATIDTERFSQHFDDAPVVEVSGRTYPVEVRYRPLLEGDEEERDRSQVEGVLDAVDELSREGKGDVLVFLSGEREIRETAEALRKHHPPHTEILPLYARLSASEQNRVFAPHGGRRIVLATNVAETSLTVPGIRYVVDPGTARISRYSHRTKVQRLPVEAISQASANQRAGRCGRVGPGVCIRLYAEEEYASRIEFTDPEIKRTNLAAVILQMASLGLGDVEKFPFVDPPDRKFINDGFKTLFELGAIDEARNLTQLGQELARLPVDPRVGRMVLQARHEGCLTEVLVVAAALSIQDPRDRPMEHQQAADEKHKRHWHDESDFVALLNLWNDYHEEKRKLSQKKLRAHCKANFLSFNRMREWHDIHQQLHNQVADMGLRFNEEPPEYDALHRALLAGLLGNIGFRTEEKQFLGARNVKFNVFPGSSQFKKPPKWLMAAELAETAKLYARTVARIEPEWIEPLAGHLVKKSWSEPHWSKRAGQVSAYEKVTLYGLTIVPKRRVNYGPINPAESREIFIREGLVEGQLNTRGQFFKHNQALIEEIEAMEHKSRRRDLMVDEYQLQRFYDERIPEGVYALPSFEKWRKRAEEKNPKLLFLTREYLMQGSGVDEAQFPNQLTMGELTLPLEYHFEPGHAADGVTLRVPLAALNLIDGERCDWLVPGLLREKVVLLIKSLPKQLRKHFVPAPDYADAALGGMSSGEGNLVSALAARLKKMSGTEIPLDAWRLDTLPDHFLMNFRVVDERNKAVVEGRDLAKLQRTLGERAQESLRAQPSDNRLERSGMHRWECDTLPEQVELERAGVKLHGFPALVDEGEGGVAVKLFDGEAKAATAMAAGLRRLIRLTLPKEIKYLARNLPEIQRMCLHYAPVGRCDDLKRDLIDAAVDHCFIEGREFPRDRKAFEARINECKPKLVATANTLCERVDAALAEYHQLRKRLKGAIHPHALEAAADVKAQLDRLIGPGFLVRTPSERLADLPRYLKAIDIRLEKVGRSSERDRAAMLDVQALWRGYTERHHKLSRDGVVDSAVEAFRWRIEELRVSLFAQELGTRETVSVKRLEKNWREIQSGK